MHEVIDCLIVGGGIAGLTSAAYLSKYGYRTVLCEQQPKLGGLIGSFTKNDYVFDQGIRAFENSGILFPMLRAFGIELDLVKNPVKLGIGVDFVDLSEKDFLRKYGMMLTKYYPKEADNIQKIINKIEKVILQMDVLYEIDNPIFVEGKFELKYITKTLLPWLKRYKKSMKQSKEFQTGVVNYLSRFTQNQSLIDIITQHFFEKTPAFFALSYFGFYRDYQYPVGGTGVLVDKMVEYLKSKDTTIKTETKIVSIDPVLKVATTHSGEKIYFKELIWAGNQKALYESLTTIPNKKAEKLKNVMRQSRGSDSVLTLYLGIDMDAKHIDRILGPHSFYTAHTEGLSHLQSWKNATDKDTWLKDFLKYTTYEISIPALRDPLLAPKGHLGVIISTLFHYDLACHYRNHGEVDDFKKLVSEHIVSLLDKSILPGLKDHVIFRNISTPLTIEAFTGNLDGSITGWSYANPVMPAIVDFTYIRNAVNTPLKNVYQCGQWTFSPAGMPTSVLTGKVAADKIIKGKYKNG